MFTFVIILLRCVLVGPDSQRPLYTKITFFCLCLMHFFSLEWITLKFIRVHINRHVVFIIMHALIHKKLRCACDYSVVDFNCNVAAADLTHRYWHICKLHSDWTANEICVHTIANSIFLFVSNVRFTHMYTCMFIMYVALITMGK